MSDAYDLVYWSHSRPHTFQNHYTPPHSAQHSDISDTDREGESCEQPVIAENQVSTGDGPEGAASSEDADESSTDSEDLPVFNRPQRSSRDNSPSGLRIIY